MTKYKKTDKGLLGLVGLTLIMSIVGISTYYLGTISIIPVMVVYIGSLVLFITLCKKECDKLNKK